MTTSDRDNEFRGLQDDVLTIQLHVESEVMFSSQKLTV